MRICFNNQINFSHIIQNGTSEKQSGNLSIETKSVQKSNNTDPLKNCYYKDIKIGTFFNTRKTVPDIDYEEYMAMAEHTKKRLRMRYNNFYKDKNINKLELFDAKYNYMPLSNERDADEFIKASKIYFNYKENPIICLGRSPKWFLNTALWMKDGIKPYSFAAFSKYWYRPDPIDGMKRINQAAPTPEEEMAYRKYLKRVQADPKTIVKNMEKTGKKTVITDYICSGKGICSFLEVMGNCAKDMNILEDFSKSIKIVGIGSMDYLEELNPYADSYSEPSVIMPEVLAPYERNIDQKFYNMDYRVFQDMLINQNTNECRSTYYPHSAWTVYKPDRFKTGLIKDMKKVEEIAKQLKGNVYITSFTPAMRDYRNLLNFRILDALWLRNLLKDNHITKI